LKKAVSLKPDYAAAHYNLGLSYPKNNDKESASKEYDILKALDNQKAEELLKLIND
jgi:Tfp pilus assembly protein PilF